MKLNLLKTKRNKIFASAVGVAIAAVSVYGIAQMQNVDAAPTVIYNPPGSMDALVCNNYRINIKQADGTNPNYDLGYAKFCENGVGPLSKWSAEKEQLPQSVQPNLMIRADVSMQPYSGSYVNATFITPNTSYYRNGHSASFKETHNYSFCVNNFAGSTMIFSNVTDAKMMVLPVGSNTGTAVSQYTVNKYAPVAMWCSGSTVDLGPRFTKLSRLDLPVANSMYPPVGKADSWLP